MRRTEAINSATLGADKWLRIFSLQFVMDMVTQETLVSQLLHLEN